MEVEYKVAKEIGEKYHAVEKIIQYTQDGLLNWEQAGNVYTTNYKDALHNHIEFENYAIQSANNGSMCKINISNENGKVTIYNGDITADLQRRLVNSIINQIESANVLSDFL